MIGSEFAGNLSKNLGSTLGTLDNILQGQLSQLKDLAIQKARATAEGAISDKVKQTTGVDVSGALSGIDPNNLASSAQSAGQSLAMSQGMTLASDLKNKSLQAKKTIEICKKIKRILNTIQGPIGKLSAIVSKITEIIIAANIVLKILIQLLKRIENIPIKPIVPPLPVPAAPGATPPGIPTIYPSVGTMSKLNKLAEKTRKFIEKITGILDSLSKVLTKVAGFLKLAVGLLYIIKPLLNSICPDSLTGSATSSTTSTSFEGSQNTQSASNLDPIDSLINQLNNIVPKDVLETENSYKGYTFEVIEDLTQKSASGKVNKRYAIAKNEQGIEVFRSESSFATNKQILISELKFKIDNYLSTSSV